LSRGIHSLWQSGTAAERGAYTTTGLGVPFHWWETDTEARYWWTGTGWAGLNVTAGQALAVTTGGTLALGGFTFTVPATGTGVLGGGSGTATRIAYWSDANTLTSDAGLTFDPAAHLFAHSESVDAGYVANRIINTSTTGTVSASLGFAARGNFLGNFYAQDTGAARLFVFQSLNSAALTVESAAQMSFTTPTYQLFQISDAGTNNKALVYFQHITSGTPVAGFGLRLRYRLNSSTTYGQDAASDYVEWVDAVHATRTARRTLTIFDTAEREAIRIEASGSAPLLGFFGHTASAQQAYTAVSNPPTQAEVTAIRDCLVNLGLMAAS
jgi:hypothetical protein